MVTNQRGIILVVALMTVALLMAMAGAAYRVASIDLKISSNLKLDRQSFGIAEAGIQHGRVFLTGADADSILQSGGIILSDQPFGGGTYSVSVVNNATDPGGPTDDTDRILELNSIGQFITSQNSIRSVVKLPDPKFIDAVHVENFVTISGGVCVDSYNSSLGAYSGVKGGTGVVGSCSEGSTAVSSDSILSNTITVSGDVRVNGDLLIGPGGDTSTAISVDAPSVVEGILGTESNIWPMPTPVLPVGLSCIDLSLGGSDTETLPGGTYCFSQMSIGGSAQLVFTGEAKIYLTGPASISGNGITTADNKATNLTIYNTSTDDITVSGSADLYAAIDSPDANFTLSGTGDFFGAVMTNNATLSGSGGVHFDEALLAVFGKTEVIGWLHLM